MGAISYFYTSARKAEDYVTRCCILPSHNAELLFGEADMAP